MHGRLKIRTSEEEAARKKKEQALKVKAYRAGMAKIVEKRAKGELDNEMMTVSGQILLRNPDVYTLWNIRKECILKMTADDVEIIEEEKQQIYDKDLGFTEQCLMVNPKSYGAWHHRCWILENCPKADIQREVALCNKYLKLDERNFHTWDYRRYVVAKAGIEPSKELDFCTEKIRANFSNYSSWHYRSKLLPLLYPHETDPNRPISELKLEEELEMVLTAAFTDPNDSSAWFYQRWLLGYSRPQLDVTAFRMDANQAVVAFTKPITIFDFSISFTNYDGPPLKWKSSNETISDSTWFAKIETTNPIDSSIELLPVLKYKLDNEDRSISLKKCSDGYFILKCPKFEYEFGSAIVLELQTQLESCNQLLQLEPDSKWTLLTSALLMRAIDRNKYHGKCLEHLQKLQQIDYLRKGYYQDLASKWIMEKSIEEWQLADKNIPYSINLQNMNLTSISHEQCLCIASEINLQGNLLNDRCFPKLKAFRFAKKIHLDDNRITSVEAVTCLKQTTETTLAGNPLIDEIPCNELIITN